MAVSVIKEDLTLDDGSYIFLVKPNGRKLW